MFNFKPYTRTEPVKEAKAKFSDGYAEFEDGEVIHDKDVADFVKRHLHIWDRLNMKKVTTAVLATFAAMADENCELDDGNWKF